MPHTPEADLNSMSAQLKTISSEMQAGEPPPPAITLQGRVARWLKRRLYRLLWWQSYQLERALLVISRWTGEKEVAIQELQKRLLDLESKQTSDASGFSQQIGQTLLQLHNESSQREQLSLSLTQLTQRFEAGNLQTNSLTAHMSELTQKVDAESTEMQQLVGRLSELTQKIHGEIAQTQQLASHLSELTKRVDDESAQKHEVATRLSSLGQLTKQTKDVLSIQDRRLSMFIEEARRRLPESSADSSLKKMMDDHSAHRHDPLYAAFEDVFRGSRQEIKTRQAVYLPLLKEHSIGSPDKPILDLGCGRGEWLELLGEHSLQARGVDSNEEMVERCKSFGLQIEAADSLAYLMTLAAECIGAVTAFHMVEHMPFEIVLKLIDESLRVLRPGGLLVLETPNPANLLVGAYTFHLDPTHRKPLPSALLRFAVEGRGFCGVYVQDLHPYPEAVRLPSDNGGVASRFNDFIYGPQDYAVIGRKP